MGCHFLLQGIFPTQGLNPGFLHCRWILYHLSHQRSPLNCSVCLVIQSYSTLCDTIDYSPRGSSVHVDSPDKNTGVGCHALLQEVFPTQGLNPHLPHCKWVFYHLNHQGSPFVGVIKQKSYFGVRKSLLHLKCAFTGIYLPRFILRLG